MDLCQLIVYQEPPPPPPEPPPENPPPDEEPPEELPPDELGLDVIEDLDVKTPMQLIDEFFELQNNRKMNEVQEEIVTNIIDEVWGMN